VAALAISSQSSDSWEALAPSTREMRKRILDKIVADRGTAIVKGLSEEHIKRDLKGMEPGSANNRLRIWRVLLTHAVEEEWIDRNPAHQVLKRKTKANPREPWSEEQVKAFRAHWAISTKQRLAFEEPALVRRQALRCGRIRLAEGPGRLAALHPEEDQRPLHMPDHKPAVGLSRPL
jgi:site-specific recombinase XerD